MRKRKVYVAFVDFRKAFDSVKRNLLYKALRKAGVKGRLLKAIQSVNQSVKASVRINDNIFSSSFDCPSGLRQGCSLSPILFITFINELVNVLYENGARGIQITPDIVEISILLFADDIALLADTVQGLQFQLNVLHTYCNE